MKTNAIRYEAFLPLLRAEEAAKLLAALVAYQFLGGSWWHFAALFLLPDLVMAGYWFGPRIGAWVYNAGHSYAGPLLLTVVFPSPLWLVWLAHIAFDRMLGFGLKSQEGFRVTHLGRIGK